MGSWSLVKKLMVLYFLSTLGILLAVSLFLYPSFIKAFHHKNDFASSSLVETFQKTPIKEKWLKESHEITIECFKKSILALLLSVLCALGLGYIISRNGLRRIEEFNALMANITATALHERVNPKDWPKELKDLGRTFNLMLDRLQISFNKLNQFSSDLAHELRTPVNNLKGLTEVALTQHKPVAYKQLLESHLEELDYLSRLIENLLFIARSSNGQIELNKKKLELKKEIIKIFDFYSALTEENNIELLCTGYDVVIDADLVLFKRVINNLISNALRYTPKGGKVTCHITHEDSGYVAIIIKDTGIGVKKEHLEKLFDRFYRVDFARDSITGGLGLGLAIVKSIMDLHQGKVTLESKEQQGTCVKLFFPLPSI